MRSSASSFASTISGLFGAASGYGIHLLYLSLRNCPGFLQTLPAYPGFKIAEAISKNHCPKTDPGCYFRRVSEADMSTSAFRGFSSSGTFSKLQVLFVTEIIRSLNLLDCTCYGTLFAVLTRFQHDCRILANPNASLPV
jgi:hypothetical protein